MKSKRQFSNINRLHRHQMADSFEHAHVILIVSEKIVNT